MSGLDDEGARVGDDQADASSSILVLCTANQCRSPMAAALLRRQAALRGINVRIDDAGFLEGGVPSPPELLEAAAAHRLDLSAHLSRQIDPPLVKGADLIITMTRRQLRDIAVDHPGVWPHTFTLRELIRRGDAVGVRDDDEPLAEWLAAVHEGRVASELLGADPMDDIDDPMGGEPPAFALLATTLTTLTWELAELIWPED